MGLWTPPGTDLGELAPPEPDPRMVTFSGGFDEYGEPRPMTYRRLREHADSWVITTTTPEGPATLLKTARDMFALSFYCYEQLVVAAAQSLFGVEVALKLRLGRKGGFQHLIQVALNGGLISSEVADIVDTGRAIRNDFVHEGKQPVWTFGLADNVIGASYRLVSDLRRGAERSSGSHSHMPGGRHRRSWLGALCTPDLMDRPRVRQLLISPGGPGCDEGKR